MADGFRRCGGTTCWRGSTSTARPRRHRLATLVEEFVAALPAQRTGCWSTWPSRIRCRSPTLSALAGARRGHRRRGGGRGRVDGDRVRPAHPLFVDAVRDALGGPELRTAAHRAGRTAGRRAARGVVDRLRLAVLALDSDNPQPVADLVAAAAEALRLGDLELSERFGRAALERDPDLPARLTLAYALAWQGRGRDADAVLADVDPSTLSETELMAWALPRAANQFWMLSRTRAGDRVPADDAQPGVDACRADHARRAVCDVRDERGQPEPRQADRRRGARVARGRRHRGRVGGGRGGVELRADGPVRRGRRAGRAGDRGADIPGCCGSPAASARRRRW